MVSKDLHYLADGINFLQMTASKLCEGTRKKLLIEIILVNLVNKIDIT